MIKSGFFVSWCLFATGEGIAPFSPEIGTITQVGALGVLAWVAWTQRLEIQSLRKEHKAVIDVLCIRWDGWEKVRHEDSDTLNEALRGITTQCAETRTTVVAAHENCLPCEKKD